MHDELAGKLARLYELSFGGKPKGRYRIAAKLLNTLAGRRRLYEDDIKLISRALLERGFVMIDMESYYSVLSTATASSYRRVNSDAVAMIEHGRSLKPN